MSARANVSGWDVMDRIVILGTLLSWLFGLYKKRNQVWKSVKSLAVKGLGMTASFLGLVVLGSDGWAVWNFSRFLSFESLSSTVGSSLGATIGAMVFAGLGAYFLAGGICLVIPNTRPGRYAKRRFFRILEHKGKTILTRRTDLKRVPAASVLWSP